MRPLDELCAASHRRNYERFHRTRSVVSGPRFDGVSTALGRCVVAQSDDYRWLFVNGAAGGTIKKKPTIEGAVPPRASRATLALGPVQFMMHSLRMNGLRLPGYHHFRALDVLRQMVVIAAGRKVVITT